MEEPSQIVWKNIRLLLLGVICPIAVAFVIAAKPTTPQPNLPSELAFLKDIADPTIVRDFHHIGSTQNIHPVYTWFTPGTEQEFARTLKTNLTRANGWKLRFPDTTQPYRAIATKKLGTSPEESLELVTDGHIVSLTDHRQTVRDNWYQIIEKGIKGAYTTP